MTTINNLHECSREGYLQIPNTTQGAGSTLLPRVQKGPFVGYTDVVTSIRSACLKRNELGLADLYCQPSSYLVVSGNVGTYSSYAD